ncbi:diguanylate cyclase domain-containing protein [Caldimonas tepidiphila]|uniref:diguanylate cyclase domain-containing protein n=1 Tax=Caldimonas tepidiphila TaxID=2315841 RepID=UPI00130019E5|nr:diguanylate cyclase [Caldimonas tepidiphila]
MDDSTVVHRAPARVFSRLASTPAGMWLIAALVAAMLLVLVALATRAQVRLEEEQERVLVGERLKGLLGTLIREMPPALTIGEGIRNFLVEDGGIGSVWFRRLSARFTRDQPLIRGVLLLRGDTVVDAYPAAFLPLLGRDLSGEARRAAALAAARATRRSLTLGPMPAMTEVGESLNTIVPVFGMLPGAAASDGYWGAVVVVVDPQPLLQRLQGLADELGITLAGRVQAMQGASATVLFGPPELFEETHVEAVFPLPGAGEWVLGAQPRQGWHPWSGPTVLLATLGVGMSLGSALLVYVTLRSRARIRFMAFHDMLTKLPNRRLFQARLREALARAERVGTPGALLLVDLDGFKQINDTHGHPAGDQLLKTLSRRMREVVGGEPHVVARTGGDEFAVLLHGVQELGQATEVAERLIHALSQPVPFTLSTGQVGASIGIALFPADGTEMAELLMRTDQALYRVKSGGRNAYAWVGEMIPRRGG